MLDRARTIVSGAWATALSAFWRATALFTLAVLLVALTPLSNKLASWLVVKDEAKKADLIVVLGGGAHRAGALSGASNERLIHGLRLFRLGYAPIVYFSGGTITDTKAKVTRTVTGTTPGEARGPQKADVVEAAMMREIALELGIPGQYIQVDAESTDTHENFAALKTYMQKSDAHTCLVVTSSTHMYRARATYKKLGLDCSFAPLPNYVNEIDSTTGRLSLMRAVLWEFSAIVLYYVLSYI